MAYNNRCCEFICSRWLRKSTSYLTFFLCVNNTYWFQKRLLMKLLLIC